MSKKRILSLIATTALVATLFAGCASKTPAPSETQAPSTTAGETTKAPAKVLNVGLVTDQGGVNDGSFNQSAKEGIDKAVKDLGIKAQQPLESKTQDQYEPNLRTMATASDLIVGCGFMMQQSMQNISGQSTDKKFLIIDSEVKNANVSSILFKEHEGSFLAGVVAAKTTKTGKIGFIGGMEGDVINRFESGFIAGVKSVNADYAKDLMPKNDKTPGPNAIYVGSFTDPGKGYEAAKTLFNKGCDVVFAAAGSTGDGLFKAATELNKYAIGVDSDQAANPKYKDYKNNIIVSMEKKVGLATYNTIKDLQAGTFAGGTTKVLGIKEGGVGLAPTVSPNAQGIDVAKKAEDMIKAGTIVVPGTRAELLKFTPVAIQ